MIPFGAWGRYNSYPKDLGVREGSLQLGLWTIPRRWKHPKPDSLRFFPPPKTNSQSTWKLAGLQKELISQPIYF